MFPSLLDHSYLLPYFSHVSIDLLPGVLEDRSVKPSAIERNCVGFDPLRIVRRVVTVDVFMSFFYEPGLISDHIVLIINFFLNFRYGALDLGYFSNIDKL